MLPALACKACRRRRRADLPQGGTHPDLCACGPGCLGAGADRRAAEIHIGQTMTGRMRKRAPNPRRVKIHRSYTVDDAAQLFGCHRNTICHWQKEGLKPVDGKRPVAFEGPALTAFLEARRGARRRRLKPGEIYCLPCREPKEPAGDMAEYVLLTDAPRQPSRHLPDLRAAHPPRGQPRPDRGCSGETGGYVHGAIGTYKGDEPPFRGL